MVVRMIFSQDALSSLCFVVVVNCLAAAQLPSQQPGEGYTNETMTATSIIGVDASLASKAEHPAVNDTPHTPIGPEDAPTGLSIATHMLSGQISMGKYNPVPENLKEMKKRRGDWESPPPKEEGETGLLGSMRKAALNVARRYGVYGNVSDEFPAISGVAQAGVADAQVWWKPPNPLDGPYAVSIVKGFRKQGYDNAVTQEADEAWEWEKNPLPVVPPAAMDPVPTVITLHNLAPTVTYKFKLYISNSYGQKYGPPSEPFQVPDVPANPNTPQEPSLEQVVGTDDPDRMGSDQHEGQKT